jgi:mannose/fructose-specific phosphotransferase system component IIA
MVLALAALIASHGAWAQRVAPAKVEHVYGAHENVRYGSKADIKNKED